MLVYFRLSYKDLLFIFVLKHYIIMMYSILLELIYFQFTLSKTLITILKLTFFLSVENINYSSFRWVLNYKIYSDFDIYVSGYPFLLLKNS